MKITLAIPTNADMKRLETLANCILNNTADPRYVVVTLVDNCNTHERDLWPWYCEFAKKYRGRAQYISLDKRVGLTSAWKECTDASETEWTVIINDDTYLMPAWDEMFRQLLKQEPGHECYLLCHPYNWSGFAVSRQFIQDFPWRTEFPEGYHEDDDIYLRVATANGLTKKSEVYSGPIYCLPYVTNGREYLFQHSSDNADSKKSPHYTRWNQQANARVFNKYWQKVTAKTPGAIENKNGQFFKAV